MRKGRLSRFLGWPSFSLCSGWKCGGWNEPYAGDVAAVRAGLRRRILLRLRKSAKNIETGAELASGSDSSPCLNNADSRSLSSITPPPQQPIPLPHPRLKIQPQRTENRSECTSCPVPKNTIYKNKSAQRSTSNTEAYRNQIGTASHIQYPSIQTQVNTLPLSTTKNSLKKARGVCRGAAALRPLCGFPFSSKKYCAPFAKKANATQYLKKSISNLLLLYLTTRTLYIPSISLSSSNALADAALSRSIRV